MRKSAFIVFAALSVIGAMAPIGGTPVWAQDAVQVAAPSGFTVSGMGEVTVVPDIARISVGVQTQGKDSAAVAKENAARTDAVIKAIKAMGVADKDIQTSIYSIVPQFDYAKNPQSLLGYQVNNTVTITIRKIADAGGILDAATKAGGNLAGGFSFDLSDPQKAQDEALAKAVADAMRKAKIMARTAGVSGMKLAQLTEGLGEAPPRPMFMARMTKSDANTATPMEAGEMKITATVTARFLPDTVPGITP